MRRLFTGLIALFVILGTLLVTTVASLAKSRRDRAEHASGEASTEVSTEAMDASALSR